MKEMGLASRQGPASPVRRRSGRAAGKKQGWAVPAHGAGLPARLRRDLPQFDALPRSLTEEKAGA